MIVFIILGDLEIWSPLEDEVILTTPKNFFDEQD